MIIYTQYIYKVWKVLTYWKRNWNQIISKSSHLLQGWTPPLLVFFRFFLKPNKFKIFSPFARWDTSSSPLHHTFLTLCWWEGNVRRSLCKVIFKTSLFVSNEPMPKHILIAFCAVCTVYKQHACYCYQALLPFTSTRLWKRVWLSSTDTWQWYLLVA